MVIVKKLKGFIVTLIATAFGSGFTPVAPGTAGTVVGVFIIYLARDWDFSSVLALGVAIFLVGWWATWEWSKNVQQPDSQKIVIDEVLGYMLAMGTLPRTGATLLVQFILFRIFDALKPPPIRQFDQWGKRFPIGPLQSFGVIFDDLLAGLVSWGVYLILTKFIDFQAFLHF
jgi:phosphatidylglycerophosphatase A